MFPGIIFVAIALFVLLYLIFFTSEEEVTAQDYFESIKKEAFLIAVVERMLPAADMDAYTIVPEDSKYWFYHNGHKAFCVTICQHLTGEPFYSLTYPE